MSFFVKVTHVGNSSKSDNSFQSGKETHMFFGDHKNKPFASNEKLVNSKMNKVETKKCVLQRKVCNIGECTSDIFEQLHS